MSVGGGSVVAIHLMGMRGDIGTNANQWWGEASGGKLARRRLGSR
jgi:hypothetical protein